ncbi:small polypeptide DEVIL 22-like [Elaeis guineensis]|uniref:small polypeptide DEVIL 22-like n=1 Tax=Elaeis guineensis var. tenera TaxID=51953 RepID=UPI003C6D7937
MDEKWKLSKKGSTNSSCSASRRMVVGEGGPFLKRSASMREGKSSSGSPRSFSSRCASLVKEQRARFYIMRRCVTMLICWRDYP